MKAVKGYIERKTMLYKTDVEYGDYTMNHVLGCAHGCKYPCYAFLMKKRFGQVASYEDWMKPYLVSNTLEILDREIPRLKDKIASVQLCFTTDPFMSGYDEIEKMSLAAIKKLNNAAIKCTVLTKGLLPAVLADCSKDNEYGITLISVDEDYRARIESGAASYKDRLAALKALHDKGCKTWVSIEPYPTPNLIKQDLGAILETITFTDKIIFGRTNYSKEISAYTAHRAFYNEQAKRVIAFCTERDIQFHVKDGTISEFMMANINNKIPNFETEEEEVVFWDRHSLDEFDELEEVHVNA
jgi:DNA repair photolyase